MNTQEAKRCLDKIIDKARIHLYKPIQIAEILYHQRMVEDIDLLDLEVYRTPSRKWRDIICLQFLGRISTSSARYQDDVFNENAVPPKMLAQLGIINKQTNGAVEAYIYKKFAERFTQMSSGLDYCNKHNANTFNLTEFINLFWLEAGLRRSIDKIYEIIVYALFSSIVDSLELTVEVAYNADKIHLIKEFEDFATKVINLDPNKTSFKTNARIHRLGVTNASDRGMDMWANFGLAIQIKHLSLSEELAENIVSSVSADRIVIVCKAAEQKVIVSLLNQMGWHSKIQSIITENDLINWYEKALRGKYANEIGEKMLQILTNEIKVEFPATNSTDFQDFYESRGYHLLY